MFGGIVASCVLTAARDLAPERTPAAIDCRFIRGLQAGRARAAADVIHAGRSLSTISVDVLDEQDRLATRAIVSLVDRDVLAKVERPPSRPPDVSSFEEAPAWPAVAPIVSVLEARTLGSGDWGVASGVLVPWTNGGSAEAACIAGDMAVGPPVGFAMAGEKVSTPNPDLSLRFCGEVTTPHLVGVGRTEAASGGVAAVSISVWSGEDLVAVGVSCSLLLPLG